MKKITAIVLGALSVATVRAGAVIATAQSNQGKSNTETPTAETVDITNVLKNENGCVFEAGVKTPKESNIGDFGVAVTANSTASKFSYNGIVDLNEQDTFLGFMFTPTQHGSNETNSFIVTLTDIYDENKYLTMEFMCGTVWGYPDITWIRFSESGKYTGIGSVYAANAGDGTADYHYLYNPIGAPDYAFEPSSFGSSISTSFHGKVGENRYVPSYFYYSAEEKAIYGNSCYSWAPERYDKLFDFDNPYLVGSNVFEGFTTNEVYLTVEMNAVASGSHILLTDFGGVDMSKELPNVAPKITLDTCGYKENALPYGVKGETATYPIFNALAYSPRESIFKVEDISVRYGGETIPVINGRFATKKSGVYTIFYNTVSEFGYKVGKQVQVVVKDGYEQEVEYTFNEAIPTEVQLGSGKIYLPDGVAKGGSGNLNIERTLTLNGEPVRLYSEGTVDYFLPIDGEEMGVYELCYSVTDITGRTVEFKRDIIVSISDKPVLSNVYVPEAVRVGFPTVFAKATAVYYKNEEKLEAPVKVRVNGQMLAEDLSYTPTQEEELTVEYIAYNPDAPADESKAFIRAEQVKTLKLTKEEGAYFASYFLTENLSFASAADTHIQYAQQDALKIARMTYANALAAMNFSVKFDVSKGNTANKVRVILTDSKDADISVVFEIRNEGGFAVLYINGVKQGQIVGSFAEESTQDLAVQYSNYDYSVCDFTGDVVGKVTHTAKGDIFEGFTSELVYMTLEIEGSAITNLSIYFINGQMFSNGVVDRKAPDIFFDEQIAFARYFNYGDTVVVPAAKAYDVFSGVASLNVEVKTPGGTTLYSGAADKAYTFKAEHYGLYTIEYIAVDTNGRETKLNCSVEIVDYTAPQIVGEYTFAEAYRIGDTVSLPNIEATDNIENEIKTYYVIITPNGYWKIPSGNSYTFRESGYYKICLCAVDEACNITRLEFNVAVGE